MCVSARRRNAFGPFFPSPPLGAGGGVAGFTGSLCGELQRANASAWEEPWKELISFHRRQRDGMSECKSLLISQSCLAVRSSRVYVFTIFFFLRQMFSTFRLRVRPAQVRGEQTLSRSLENIFVPLCVCRNVHEFQ